MSERVAERPRVSLPDVAEVKPSSQLLLIRFLLAVAGSGVICLLVWLDRSNYLMPPVDIVGYPTFANFDYTHLFTAYRLATYLFPLLGITLYALLYWRGPLRGPVKKKRTEPIALSIAEPLYPVEFRPTRGSAGTHRPPGPKALAVAALRLLPPALFLGLVINTIAAVPAPWTGAVGVWWAIFYVLIVLALATLVRWRSLRSRRSLPVQGREFVECVAVINAGAGAVVAIGGVFIVSANSEMIFADGSVHNWPWLPWWLASVGILAAWTWLGWQIRRGRAPVAVERRLRTVVLGSAFLYLLTAHLPGPVAGFQGFDDAQSVVGADLLRRGYFPWRDFFFIHGVFLDALRSTVAFAVYGPTQWGSEAGAGLLFTPACWITLYLLAVWAVRRGSFVVLAVLAFAAWGTLSVDIRFVAVPLVFLLLGQALQRANLAWTAAFCVALFVNAVLVPETGYQVLGAVVALVGADFVHRRPGVRWYVNMRRTVCFLLVSAALSIVWAGYLALHHSLSAFFEYYVIFGPGHDAAGAHAPSGISGFEYFAYFAMIGLVCITAWICTWRFRGRHAWTPVAWVTLAAAITAALYGEKALGRLDGPHLQQGITMDLSLFVLSLAAAVPAAEDYLRLAVLRGRSTFAAGAGLGTGVATAGTSRTGLRTSRDPLPWFAQPVAVLGLILGLVAAPTILGNTWRSPQDFHAQVGAQLVGTRLGYATATALPPGVLPDITSVLNTYGRGDSPVFDMTNSLGYFYFLLHRPIATPFVHVSMAIPEFAQSMLVNQLARTRPRVVVFDSDGIGVPGWDGVSNEVRHFQVSQYVLDGWTPVVKTHGLLFMLRNDLVPTMPNAPILLAPAQTAGLYFGAHSCDWGDAANFLESAARGESVTVRPTLMPDTHQLTVAGWAADSRTGLPARRVVLAAGGVVVGVMLPTVARPDVVFASANRISAGSGFQGTILTTKNERLTAYADIGDGALHPLTGADSTTHRGTLRMPDGARRPVTTPGLGRLDTQGAVPIRFSKITVPGTAPLGSYALATFSAAQMIGESKLALSDVPVFTASTAGHEIAADVLPIAGSALAVRVGSCLPWHGYRLRTLYLTQTAGGAPITSVTLSGVGG